MAARITKAASAGFAMLLTASLAGCSGAQSSDEYVLHYTSYSNAASDQNQTVQWWAEEVERQTEGKVTVKFHYSESLVGADEALMSANDGRSDLAHVASIYSTSDLPTLSAVELPFQTTNPEAQLRAIDRLYRENEEFKDDFNRNGVEFLFPLPLGNNLIGTKEPVDDLADLKGMSIRGGGLTSEVLLAAGANPVTMTAGEVYESMERGVVDGWSALALSSASTYGLSESTPYVLQPGIGVYATSLVVVNSELLASMPQEYQDIVRDTAGQATDKGLQLMSDFSRTACEEFLESGTEFTTLPSDQIAAWEESAGIDDDWVQRLNGLGYDGEGLLEHYQNVIDEEEKQSQYQAPILECIDRARGQ